MGASEAEVRTLHCRKHGAPTMRFSGLCVRPDDVLARLPVRDDNGDVVISEKLRQTSLLGSATFMRILASAYQTLISKDTGISARLFHRTAQHATAARLAHNPSRRTDRGTSC